MANSTRRRDVITLAAAAATFPITWPFAAGAQQRNPPVVGFLTWDEPKPHAPYVEAFRAGLAEAGFLEGRDTFIEYRWAGNSRELQGMAAELVRLHVAIIVAWDGPSIRAAKDATSTIPIAFAYGGDPVNDGLVASLNRPGGNVTGITIRTRELTGKQLDLLLKMVPRARKVGYLSGDRSFGLYEEQTTSMLAAGRALGAEIMIVECRSDRDFDGAVAKMVDGGAEAMILAIFGPGNPEKVVSLAMLHKMPTMYPAEYLVRAGGLMSYQTDIISTSRRLGIYYVARLLKGEKPANLPIEREDRFKLAINLKTAKAISLEVPPQLLAIADEVIEPPGVWNLMPTITVVSGADDPRVPLVSDAVAFWNDTFAQLGTPFRLGALTRVVGAIPVEDLRKLSPFNVAKLPELPESLKRIIGNIIVVLSESDFSFAAPEPALDKVVVAISDYQFPLTLPNVARNVISRQLGLSIGLSPNADPTTLMCGRPFGGGLCPPRRFASDRTEYFPLTQADKAEILRMYPKSWQASR
jgi:putative ABC transport system substrate-binding protein